MTTARAERRSGWALPPAPPAEWVGSRWFLALCGALVTAVGIPALALREDGATSQLAALVALHAGAGAATLVTAEGCQALAVSPSGGQVVATMAEGPKLWRLNDGALIAPVAVEGHGFAPPLTQFSPVDATRLLATPWNASRIYCRAPNDGLPIE